EPSTRYCQPWLSSRFVSTCTKPLSTSITARRMGFGSEVIWLRVRPDLTGRYGRALRAFTACSQPGYSPVTARPRCRGRVKTHGGSRDGADSGREPGDPARPVFGLRGWQATRPHGARAGAPHRPRAPNGPRGSAGR